MAGPFLKLFLVHGYREAFYQLSSADRDAFWARDDENTQEAGARFLVACDSRWCNEAWAGWGVKEYPNVQAVQKNARAMEEDQLFRYLDSESYLATPMEGIQTFPVDLPNPLYQLFLLKNHDNNAWESLPKEERDRLYACVMESIQKHGGIPFLAGNCEWSNEEYSGFGVIAWPSLEAEQAHFKDLVEIGWRRYSYAKTILGYPMG